MFATLSVISDDEVRLHSYGCVDNPDASPDDDWAARRGSLFDPRIFGPERDFECACGQFRGRQNRGIICHECGVKVDRAKPLRRRRFGHINLNARVPHPLEPSVSIGAIPVLPIAYRTDTGTCDLDDLYAAVVRANLDLRPTSSGTAETLGALDEALCALFANEIRHEPRTWKGRVIRSLSCFAFEAPDRSMCDLGVFLHALMLRVTLRYESRM